MKHLVIGRGEVGTAIQKIFNADYLELENSNATGQYDFIHICIPYTSDSFVNYVKSMKVIWLADNGIVVIHSTVPVGTTRACGDDFVHSPIRGVHPNLEEGIKTFTKFIGGIKSLTVSREFDKFRLTSRVTSNSDETEAMKLWDTTQYAVSVMLEKEIYKYCKENGLNFDVVYTEANETYNDGYSKFDMSHVIRPVLEHMEGKIGGHCLIPNCELLDSPTAKRVLNENKEL